MPEREFQVPVVTQVFASRVRCAELPGFPELACVETDPKRLDHALKTRVKQVLEASPLADLHRRTGPIDFGTLEYELVQTPPRRHASWSEPVTLRFACVTWRHDAETQVVFVPSLGLQVVVQGRQNLEKRLEAEIRAALLRSRFATMLGGLAGVQRAGVIETTTLAVAANVRTPRQVAADERREDPARTILGEAATDLCAQKSSRAWEVDEAVTLLAETLGGTAPRSVLLLGPSGAGKTAVFMELVRRRRELGFGHTPFFATSGSRLVAGQSGAGMWQERCVKLIREASKQRAIVHLGSLFELLNVGASACSAQGIASFLRPGIARGDWLVVVEATSEELSVIERRDPQLANAFQRIELAEPDDARLRRILSAVAAGPAEKLARELDDAGLDAVLRLHARYATYSARPGRPLRFLRNLLSDDSAEGPRQTGAPGEREVIAAFARETGLPLWLLDDAAPLDLPQTREWLSQRVIGQAEAVDQVVDMLALVKTRLARPRRPLASFLFIGPTGVGKTEMVKALAEFLFGDAQRMVRLDMSEYADAAAATRLVGTAWDEEGLLTARLREHPFCVVLLDEFEKAHPAVHDLLLQALGEARLTDAAGRVASLANAVIVLTSNLGAQDYQRAPAGFAADADARRVARDHFLGALEGFLRPELFNRLDAVIPFLPLDRSSALAVTERELRLARRRDGLALRPVRLALADGVSAYLMRRGFEPGHGARVLKRTIERELLVPLADALNRYAENEPLQANVRLEGDRLAVTVRSEGAAAESNRRETARGVATEIVSVRREARKFRASQVVSRIDNEAQQAEVLSAQAASGKWLSPADRRRIERLPRWRRFIREVEQLVADTALLEEDTLAALYASGVPLADAAPRLGTARNRLRECLQDALGLEIEAPDHLLLGIYHTDEPALALRLASAYLDWACPLGFGVTVHAFQPRGVIKPRRIDVELRPVIDVSEFLARDPASLGPGVVLEFNGPLVRAWLEGEEGAHVFIEKSKDRQIIADPSASDIARYEPPSRLTVRRAQHRICRTFDSGARTIADSVLGVRVWSGDLARGLAMCLTDRFEQRLRAPLEG